MAPSWEHKDADPIIEQKAVEYIEKQKNSDQPFFLYLSPSVPHEPRVESVVPEFARGQSEAGPRGDQVWLADWIVEQVTDALERTGTENTLIFVTSDNGALPGIEFKTKAARCRIIRMITNLVATCVVTKPTAGKMGIANLSLPDGLVLLSQKPPRINSCVLPI